MDARKAALKASPDGRPSSSMSGAKPLELAVTRRCPKPSPARTSKFTYPSGFTAGFNVNAQNHGKTVGTVFAQSIIPPMANGAISRAEAVFKQIMEAKNRFDGVKALLDLKAGESEFLEYKGAVHCLAKDKQDDVKRIWCKALSGFSNGDGGVLIWGIDAPENEPRRLALPPNASELRSNLLEYQAAATEPAVVGVSVEVVKEASDKNEGFVLCLIPSSPWKPHKAKYGQDQYYVRIGDGFTPATHSLLRALFYPVDAVRFSIYGNVRVRNMSAVISIWLSNAGPSSAYDVFLGCELPQGCLIPTPDIDLWVPTVGSKGMPIAAKRPIHPTEEVPIFATTLSNVRAEDRWYGGKPMEFRFTVYAKNQQPTKFKLLVGEDEIASNAMFHAQVS